MPTQALDDIRDRMTTIEGAVSRIADAMELVARVDERVLELIKARDDHEGRLRVVEHTVSAQGYGQHLWSKLVWIIVAALVGVASTIATNRLEQPAIVSTDIVKRSPENV